LGFERAGMECIWQVEIDEHCNKVLGKHFPNVRRRTDVREVGKGLEPVELICGGFPCQDLSVAGKRKGLVGERSGLWFEFHRIVEELTPKWVVIENVPGLLSSNGGEDFAIILQGLVKCGYGVSWRILDSQYFGVAQRRRRVFIIGSLGNGRSAEVLFECESLSGNPAKGRKTREEDTERITSGFGHSGGKTVKLNPIANTLNAQSGSKTTAMIQGVAVIQQNTRDEVRVVGDGKIAGALPAQPGMKQQNYVVFDWQSGGDVRLNVSDKHTSALQASQTPAVVIPAFDGRAGRQTLKSQRIPEVRSSLHGVRRLTPTECERLQAFPDGWTDKQSDTQRYKQLGNAVTVNVTEWIGKRIVAQVL